MKHSCTKRTQRGMKITWMFHLALTNKLITDEIAISRIDTQTGNEYMAYSM